MKLKKRFLIFLAILLLVLSARFLWLSLQSDANLPQRLVKEQLWKQGFSLGYKSFDVDFSLFPSIEITEATLKRNDVENASTLAEVDRLYIDFELLPFLLRGKLSLDELEVEKANIYIERDVNGTNNWFPQKQEGTGFKKPRFQLKASQLKDVRVFYSGPTFVNQKLQIKKAEISYDKKDKLLIENASGKLQKEVFEMEGDVSSLIGFLSGKGTSLNVSIKLPEKNTELKLEGEVESHSLPSMSGLRLRGEGEDLSVLLAYLPNMPSVKSNGFKFNTVVKSKDNNYFVNFENFLIHCQSNTVNFSGSLSKDNNNIAYELKVSAKGNELDALKSCSQDIAENEVFNLINDNLEIDFFQFEGEVTGNNKQVKLTDMKIDAQSQLDIMSIELNASDIASLSKVSAKVLLSGKNVENLVRRVSYWYQPDFTVPETDSYRAEFKFFLDKDVKAVEVYEANVELTKDEQMIKLQQADQSMARVDSWAFDLDAKGDDLAHWYPEFEEFHTPELLAFDFKGQVFLDQGVWGFRKSDIQLSKDENHLQLKGDVSYEQTIQQLALEFAFEGQEHDFLSMVSHETDSLDVASKVDTRLSGKLSGDSDNFSLKDFSYEGKRGELKGNIDISLGDRKKINADLGDVHLIVNLDKDENAEKTDWKEETISLDWMDNLDLKLAYEHFKLTLNDADFDLGASEIFMEDGKLDWKAISLAYLETEVLGSLFIDARQDSYHLSIDANNLDFGSLLKELGWFNDLQGRGRFLFSLEASGKTMVSLFSNMKGVGKFYLSDGKVKDFGNTSTNYIRATMPWRKNLNDLEIDCFMSRLFIEDEKLRTRKLYFSNRNMYVMGGGTLDLSTYKLDMAFSPRAHSASFLDANVSLFVQGAVDNPQVKVDKLSAVSDVGIKYGQWALLGPLALAIPKLPLNKPPTCREALDALAAE